MKTDDLWALLLLSLLILAFIILVAVVISRNQCKRSTKPCNQNPDCCNGFVCSEGICRGDIAQPCNNNDLECANYLVCSNGLCTLPAQINRIPPPVVLPVVENSGNIPVDTPLRSDLRSNFFVSPLNVGDGVCNTGNLPMNLGQVLNDNNNSFSSILSSAPKVFPPLSTSSQGPNFGEESAGSRPENEERKSSGLSLVANPEERILPCEIIDVTGFTSDYTIYLQEKNLFLQEIISEGRTLAHSSCFKGQNGEQINPQICRVIAFAKTLFALSNTGELFSLQGDSLQEAEWHWEAHGRDRHSRWEKIPEGNISDISTTQDENFLWISTGNRGFLYNTSGKIVEKINLHDIYETRTYGGTQKIYLKLNHHAQTLELTVGSTKVFQKSRSERIYSLNYYGELFSVPRFFPQAGHIFNLRATRFVHYRPYLLQNPCPV